MSGFVGIANPAGLAVDRDLLGRMTGSMTFRGPDARNLWIHDNIGFGHTLLRTTQEAEREVQPCTVDGRSWIAADCRVDARDELIRELAVLGRSDAKDATDPELILHAYAAWGTHCLDHLLGDFSFAIWDSLEKRLFCARDQIGVKLFYYARNNRSFVFGNTLNSLRLHPEVSDKLNDLAIADFLLFGYNLDFVTTSFADIQRLPPAHMLIWAGGELRIERYWNLPIDPPLRLRRMSDYTDRFLDLFRTVVKDRLRTDRVAIFMSGGLDSTSMAAIAKEVAGQGPPVELSAHTGVFDRLIPDREREYAAMAAKHLRIPIHFYPGDDNGFFEAARHGNHAYADPAFVAEFDSATGQSFIQGAAAQSRVALWGEGPDNALEYEWRPWFDYELRHGHIGSLAAAVCSYPFLFGEFPFAKRLSGSKASPPRAEGFDTFPSWLNQGLTERLHLRERFEALSEHGGEGVALHPVRPQSYKGLLTPLWQSLFESFDAGATGVPLDVRSPFMDIRMVRFLLTVPVIPWCRDKYILRRSMRGYLPTETINRPKTGLQGFPAFEKWKTTGLPAELMACLPCEGLSEYLDIDQFVANGSSGGYRQYSIGMRLRPWSLAFFLHGIDGACIIIRASLSTGGK